MGQHKEVPVTVDGVELSLRFDFNAISTIEKLTSVKLTDFKTLMREVPDPDSEEEGATKVEVSGQHLRSLVYACTNASEIKRQVPVRERLGMLEIGSLMTLESIAELTVAISQVFGGNSPEESEEGDPTAAEESKTEA